MNNINANIYMNVTFIDELNNRKWSYDNVFRMEVRNKSIFVQCEGKDCKHVFFVKKDEFSKIEIVMQNELY